MIVIKRHLIISRIEEIDVLYFQIHKILIIDKYSRHGHNKKNFQINVKYFQKLYKT